MSDLIDRQAAIDALADYIHNVDKVYSTGKLSMNDCKDAAYSVLENLPSAQPEILACGEGELNVPDTNVRDCSDCIKHGGDWDCDHVHCHKGKWIVDDVATEHCSVCKHRFYIFCVVRCWWK